MRAQVTFPIARVRPTYRPALGPQTEVVPPPGSRHSVVSIAAAARVGARRASRSPMGPSWAGRGRARSDFVSDGVGPPARGRPAPHATPARAADCRLSVGSVTQGRGASGAARDGGISSSCDRRPTCICAPDRSGRRSPPWPTEGGCDRPAASGGARRSCRLGRPSRSRSDGQEAVACARSLSALPDRRAACLLPAAG